MAVSACVAVAQVQTSLTREQALADVDELQRLLEERFSYLRIRSVDHRGLLDDVRRRAADGISGTDFAIDVGRVLAQFGDGHSRVRGLSSMAAALGHVPCAFVDVGGRVAAVKLDGQTCLSSEHPFLVSIDGVPLARWLEAAERLAPHGSPQIRRRGALEWLRCVAVLRRNLELPAVEAVTVELESADQQRRVELGMRLVPRPTEPLRSPLRRKLEARVLDGHVGYLRIADMDGDRRFLDDLLRSVEELRDTRGLIIDVRGNGGGSRAALRELFPCFMRPDDAPRVVNVAAYRLGPDEPRQRADGYLADRFLYPAGWAGWSDTERKVVDELAAKFKPAWSPPADEFSDWHYCVISPRPDATAIRYDRPVIVLMDADCFSATDIFLGAMKGWRNVTLMGTPSGGGSGRALEYTLTRSGLRLMLSSIASFRPDGHTYDGQGIEPDVMIQPSLSDALGRTDATLDAALLRLRRQ